MSRKTPKVVQKVQKKSTNRLQDLKSIVCTNKTNVVGMSKEKLFDMWWKLREDDFNASDLSSNYEFAFKYIQL